MHGVEGKTLSSRQIAPDPEFPNATKAERRKNAQKKQKIDESNQKLKANIWTCPVGEDEVLCLRNDTGYTKAPDIIRVLEIIRQRTAHLLDEHEVVVVHDAAPSHRNELVGRFLKNAGLGELMVPGGFTGLLQPLGISFFHFLCFEDPNSQIQSSWRHPTHTATFLIFLRARRGNPHMQKKIQTSAGSGR